MIMLFCIIFLVQAIHEIACAYGGVDGPFGVYTLRPRLPIPCDDSPLHTCAAVIKQPSLLVIEERDVHLDPLES